MKVNIIFLDYHRHDYTKEVMTKNFANAGYPFTYVVIDRKGIASALNEGIHKSIGNDAVVTMANDILMPEGWLKEMVRAATAIDNTGMAGIHCVESMPAPETINGVTVHPIYTAFGNVLIPFKAIEKVGYFNVGFDPYSLQDSDYAHRLINSGFINYYVEGLRAEHIGHDMGNNTPYRQMKDEALALGPDKQGYWQSKYAETNNFYLPYEQ